MSNIYDVILEEHEHHRTLMRQLSETEGDSKERRDIYAQLRVELEAHAAAEEQTFYAALIAEEDGQDKARHSIVEHNTITKHIEELDELEFSSTGWLNKFNTLRHSVEHHLEEEEGEIFDRARQVLPEGTAEAIVGEFQERKSNEVENYA